MDLKWSRSRILSVILPYMVFALLGCMDSDRPEVKYKTYDAAREAGAIRTGSFIPAFLPVNAVDIHEKHDLDTNTVWMAFTIDLTQWRPEDAGCTPIDGSNINLPLRVPRWWPNNLVAGEAIPLSYSFFRCYNVRTYLAIPSETGDRRRVYYWSL